MLVATLPEPSVCTIQPEGSLILTNPGIPPPRPSEVVLHVHVEERVDGPEDRHVPDRLSRGGIPYIDHDRDWLVPGIEGGTAREEQQCDKEACRGPHARILAVDVPY